MHVVPFISFRPLRMEESQYFNAHTHKKPQFQNVWACRNAFHFSNKKSLSALKYSVSVGLHPWHSGLFSPELEKKIRENSLANNVAAIGEVGLDKASSVDWNCQLKTWEFEFGLAQTLKLPLIIHCVKAYYEFVPFCAKTNVPMMFHGFSGNSDVLKQLSKYEHSYFSIGPQLLKNKMIQELISKIPLNRLLFETDAGKFSIIEIYETASCILKIEMKNLQLLIKNNTLEFFGQKALLHF